MLAKIARGVTKRYRNDLLGLMSDVTLSLGALNCFLQYTYYPKKHPHAQVLNLFVCECIWVVFLMHLYYTGALRFAFYL